MILKLSKSLTSITIKGLFYNYGDILEFVAEGVQQSNTLLCMEIIVEDRYLSHGQTITGLITLLNSLKSTPVQRLCFQNVLLDSVCAEVFIQLLSHNQNITDLAIKGNTQFIGTPSYYWETSSLEELIIDNKNDISIEGWTNLFQSLRHNTSLIKLNCHMYCVFGIGEVLNEMIISNNKSIQYLTIRYLSDGHYNTEALARALSKKLGMDTGL